MKLPSREVLRTGWLDWRRPRFWTWVVLLAYTLLGFLVVPWVARGAIVDSVRENLALEARLADVDFNPWVLSARLEQFGIAAGTGDDLVSFDELYVNFQASSLLRRAWTFAEIRLKGAYVDVERRADGTLNLTALVPPAGPPSPSEAARSEGVSSEGGLVRLIVDRLEIAGRADYRDATTRTPYATQFGPIDVVVLDLNTLPEREGEQRISIVGEGGARLEWSGVLAANPLHSRGKASLTGLPLEKLSAYLPHEVPATIAGGTAAFAFEYTVTAGPTGVTAAVDAMTTNVAGLRVQSTADGAASPLFDLDALTLSGGRLRWPAGEIAVERVGLTAPVVHLDRDSGGRFTWQRLVAGAAPNEPALAQHPQETDAGSSGPQWSLSLGRFEILNGAVRFADATLDPTAAFAIESIAVGADGLSLTEGTKIPFTVSLAVAGDGGTVDLGGDLQVLPELAFDARLALKGLALATVQPYLAATTWLDLESGAVDADGKVASAGDGGLVFSGTAAIADFALRRVDTGNRIAQWRQLQLDGIEADTSARRVELATARLEAAYARVRIDETGALNVGRLMRATEDGAEAAGQADPEEPATPAEDLITATAADEAPAQPWALRVRRFDLVDASADYRDDSLPIPFETRIAAFNGRLSALDTTSARPADIRFEGKVGEFGLLRVEGALQPLDFARDTLFTARFENIDLSDATPYAIRFAGRRIETGKLDLDTRYRVEQRHLAATHDIVLRDFALGERVESPDALDLPLDLALSLLKGPDGNIEVELPIEGDVDDPEFRIGGIIRKAIVNLIVKIVTSPFRLLGMLVGLGGESDVLDQVAFPPGRADLAPPEQEKIQKLAEALALRPQLRLDVPAVSAPAADSAALRRARVQARIDAATTATDPGALRRAVESLAAAVVTPEERTALVTRFTTPATESSEGGLDELAYLGALTDLLVEREPIAPEDLAAIARGRQDAVVSALVAQGIDPTRVRAGEAVETTATDETVSLVFGVDTLTSGAAPAPGTRPAEAPVAEPVESPVPTT